MSTLLWLGVLALATRSDVESVVQVNVSRLSYNFICDVELDSNTTTQIIDTGSYTLVTHSATTYNSSDTHETCVGLSVDGTSLEYQSQGEGGECELALQTVSIGEQGSATAESNITLAQVLRIQNEVLHNWSPATGNMGASYCVGEGCQTPTTFRALVQNASDSNNSEIFGLDFRSPSTSTEAYIGQDDKYADGGVESSLQLGGASGALEWLQMPQASPLYHQVFVEELLFCEHYLLGNISANWQVLVDTGSSCLTLPMEVYDHFEAWFDNTSFANASSLPAISFRLATGSNGTLYVPLGDLLVNVTAIDTEEGAPYVEVNNNQMRLCVLQGGPIVNEGEDEKTFYYPPPSIVLGAMALQSVYMGANFANQSVGFGDKLRPNYVGLLEKNGAQRAPPGGGCKAQTQCRGEERYMQASNSCKEPDCDEYYFTSLDSATQQCVYNRSDLIGGLVFVLLVALA
ncbi:hypothetical protein B484DRAFT_457551, partial [Ochromonadaceae sp. CCMP2298]